MTDLLIMASVVLIAAFVQGATGFGFALLAAPVIGIVRPALLPGFLLIEMIPLNGYVMWRERGDIDRLGITWVSAGRILGTFGGLGVLLLVTEHQLQLLIGVSTVLAVVATLLAPSFDPKRVAFVVAGLITGVTETSTGIGGPPLALVFQHRPAPTLRSSVAACFFIGEVTSLAILALTAKIGSDQIRFAVLLLPMVIIGALLSHLVHRRLAGPLMRYTVLGFALLSGFIVTVQALS